MSSEIEKRKPLRYLEEIDVKPKLNEVMLHPRIRWRTMDHRPVYFYRYNSGFMDYISYLVGFGVSFFLFLLYIRIQSIFNSLWVGFLFWFLLGLVGSGTIGFVVTHLLFFTSNKRALKSAEYGILSSILIFLMLYFGVSAFDFLELKIVPSKILSGALCITILGLFLFFLSKITKSFGRIKLYSDGFVIGTEVFDYSEIDYINYAAGPIESNIPSEHKGLPRIIMSEIEYSFKGKDYEIDHFYLVAVKHQKVYICQSIMFTSGFAANARNGLKHYNYMREKGVLYKIYR
jgi:hypothetical protein